MIEQDNIQNKKIYYPQLNKSNSKLLLAAAWGFLSILFASIQISLGTDEKIVLMAFISLMCCGIPFLFFGIYDLNAVFIFALMSKYSFFPLWIKTIFGERIDIGLISPFTTFAIALAGSIISCAALLLAKVIPIKKRVLGYKFSEAQILMAGYLATGWGLFFLTLHIIFGPVLLSYGKSTEGFGGFGTLIGPLYFGVSCLTSISMKPNTNPLHKTFLIAVGLFIMFASFRANAKIYFTFSILAFVLTVFYFSIRIKKRHLLFLGVFVVFYSFIFAPVIFVTRTMAFKVADLSGKIAIFEDLFKKNSIRDINALANNPYYVPYFASAGTLLVDRFEMITDLDIAAGGISRGNTIGWVPIDWAVRASLPSFISPNKPKISDIDLIAYNAGYISTLRTLNHTMGLFGSAYAMFLWPSLIFVSLIIITLYILMLKVIAPSNLRNNSIGIFFLATYAFNFSEQSVQGLLMTMIRGIPTDTILILGIFTTITLISSNRRSHI